MKIVVVIYFNPYYETTIAVLYLFRVVFYLRSKDFVFFLFL